MLFTDYNRFNNNLTIYTTVLNCFIGERECQFINTWRGREHHSRKLEWAWSSVEIARRRFGGHRRYGSCRRQALHWTPVHQFHRRAGQEATRKRQLRQITRQSPVDGRPFCALSCWSIAQWSRRMRCHVCLRLVAAQRAQNSGNCDRRRNFQDVVAGFGSGFSSLSATGCVTTDARRSLKYARVDISGPRSPIRGVGAAAGAVAPTLPTICLGGVSDAQPRLSSAHLQQHPSASYRRRLQFSGISGRTHCDTDWLGKHEMSNGRRFHCSSEHQNSHIWQSF